MPTTTDNLVRVNTVRCREMAELLQGLSIPPDQEESPLPGMPTELVSNFFLALVAICHQTTPVSGAQLEGVIDGRHRRGWDYLSGRFEQAVHNNPAILAPASWAEIGQADVRGLFRDPEYGELLTDPNGRAALLRDMGQRMLYSGWQSADDIYEVCRHRIAIGHPSILDTLAEFKAYRDPVRKKSFFFLALMKNGHTWTYEDNENLGAPVDYHEVRGHLRIGTVTVIDPGLRAKLLTGARVTESQELAIRRAVFDAIMYVSKASGIRDPSRLHYLFWNVFRSLCSHNDPQCLEIKTNCKLPPRYSLMTVHADGHACCPFSMICESVDKLDRFIEHSYDGHYY